MVKKSKDINISDCLLYTSLLVCTIMSGAITWYSCIIPLVLSFLYLFINRSKITKNICVILIAILLATGFVSIVLSLGDKQNAIYEYEKIMCYIIALYIGLSVKKEDTIFRGILICAITTASVGLLAYCGIVKVDEFVFNDRYILRLQSFLKYANTTALLLGCGYFAVLKLIDVSPKKTLTYLSSCVLIAFYLTVSKAAIPIFLILGTILFTTKRNYDYIFITQNLVCMAFAILIILADFKQLQFIKFTLILICIVISGDIIHRPVLQKVFSRKFLFLIWYIGIGLFLISVWLLFVLKNINIFATLLIRFAYAKDALLLLKEHWLTGIGPGAWKYYQFGIQTASYDVTYIHNGLLQIWLEYGIVFFVTILVMLIKSLVIFIKKGLYIPAAILAFIVIHSLIDINLSFGLILMVLGLLSGVALGDSKEIKFAHPVLYVALSLCMLLVGYMTCEAVVRYNFEQAYLRKESEKAIEYAEILEKICPYDSNLQLSIASLTKENTEERIERAIELSPLDIKLIETDIKYSISKNKTDITEKIKEYILGAKYRERTYVNAKEYLKQAFEKQLCSQKEFDECLYQIETQRKKYGVIDRNKLLEDLVGQK